MRSTIAPRLALLTCLFALPATATEPPDLAGRWILDQEQSETLRQKLRESSVASGDAGPRAELRRERLAARERGALERAPFAEILIHADPELVRIRYRDGSTRAIYTDGRELGADAAQGVEAARARWQEAALVIENDTPRGSRVERWQLSDDGSRLFVNIEIDSGEAFGRLDFTRIYDRQSPEAPTGQSVEPPTDGDDDDG